jgi:hypothetical protein
VLEWGPRARVVEPPELVEEVRLELEQALAAYGGAPAERTVRARSSARQRRGAAR